MKVQDWIFSVRYFTDGARDRHAVVGPARMSTVEAALRLAGVPEDVRAQICGCDVVRGFVEGRLDPERTGYYAHSSTGDDTSWAVCLGPVHEVVGR